MKANPALEFIPDNFTFCVTFFYEFGFPTILMKVEQINFEYDAVGNGRFVSINFSMNNCRPIPMGTIYLLT